MAISLGIYPTFQTNPYGFWTIWIPTVPSHSFMPSTMAWASRQLMRRCGDAVARAVDPTTRASWRGGWNSGIVFFPKPSRVSSRSFHKKKHLKHLEVLHFHRTTAEQTRCTAVVYQFFNGRGTEERPQFPGSKHQASAVALDRVHHQRPPPKSLTSSRPAAARVYGVWRCHCNLWCRPHDCLTANPKR